MKAEYKIIEVKKVKKYKDDRFKEEPWYKDKKLLEVDLKIEYEGKILDKTFILNKDHWEYLNKKIGELND